MIREGEAFEVSERVRRELAAYDRIRAVRELYAAYHRWDWRSALLADLMLAEGHLNSAGSDGFELDVVRAEPVAGARFQGGTVATWRKRLDAIQRRELRDLAEQPFFDYGRWTP